MPADPLTLADFEAAIESLERRPKGWPAHIGRRVSCLSTDDVPIEGELLGVSEYHVEVLCDDGVVRFGIKRGLRFGPAPVLVPA